jgi:hypothetical protein
MVLGSGYSLGNAFALSAVNDANNGFVPLETHASLYALLNGNVGIGTTNPTRALDLVGDVANNGTGTSSQLSLRGTASTANKLNIGYDTTSNIGFIEAVQEGVAWQNLALQPLGGNVGIGTTGPMTKLAVSDGTNGIEVAPGSTNTLQSVARPSGAWDDFSIKGRDIIFTANNVESMRLQNSTGNVGIGTTSPNHKLDVNGNVGLAAGQYINFGSTDGSSGYGFRDNAGSMQYKNSSGSWADFGTVSGGSVSLTGNNKEIQFNDNGTLASALHVTWDKTANFLGLGTATASAQLHIGGANAISFPAWTTNGIGIRQDAQTYTDSSSSGTVTNNYVDVIGQPTLAASSATTYTNATTMFIAGPPAAGSNVTITNPAALVVGSGNVGIGTTNPGALLDVTGSVGDNTTTNLLRIVDTAPTPTGRPSLAFYFAGGSMVPAQISTNVGSGYNSSKLYFSVADSSHTLQDRMAIDVNGNVGIGTTFPGTTLDLEGAGTQLFSIGGGGYAYSQLNLGKSHNSRPVITVGDANQAATPQLTFGGGYEGNYGTTFEVRSDIQNAGVGGAGYSNLGQALVVKRYSLDGTTSNVVSALGVNQLYSIGSYLGLSGGSTPKATPDVYISSSGNVGIGTTSPQETLDVAGVIKVAGTGSEVCDTAHVGAIRYNPTTGLPQMCINH